MNNHLTLVLGVVGVALAGMLVYLTATRTPEIQALETPAFSVATLTDLKAYPDLEQSAEHWVAVRLPQNDRMVVLRPLEQSEYNSFQTRAIAYEIIEWQMLAAALVLPQLDDVDFSTLSPELMFFLKARVNQISGFEVFAL